MNANYKKLIIDWGFFFIGLASIILVQKTFLAGIYGTAMENTIPNRSTVFINIFVKDFQRGDIVFYRADNGIYISRIVGLPGETIKVNEHEVYINDKLLNEPYINTINPPKECTVDMFCGPLIIPNDSYYMLGDNRGKSNDSRRKGTIQKDQIRGKAEFILLPLNKIKHIGK